MTLKAPEPAATVTVTAPPDADAAPPAVPATLDPCDGGPFPFDYALSLASDPPPPGSELGIAVANVESVLRSLGYTGLSDENLIATDGRCGEHTECAVRNSQQDMGIEPAGTVDEQTWAAPADSVARGATAGTTARAPGWISANRSPRRRYGPDPGPTAVRAPAAGPTATRPGSRIEPPPTAMTERPDPFTLTGTQSIGARDQLDLDS